MAFPGHARSLGLSYTSSGSATIVHPDRHYNIVSDYTSTKENIHASLKHSKSHSSPQDDNQDAYSRNRNDDTQSYKSLFRDAPAAGTDDQGNLPTPSLWIGNVPSGLNNDTLVDVFKRFGPISSVRATPGKKCGFVNFEYTESAEEAWRHCHETDVFGTGVAIYVRYQPLKEYPSLKRKRSSTKQLPAVSDDTLRRPIPTAPRTQILNSLPPSGPKSQQTSISPPPLRRHDTYRPNNNLEEERVGRPLVERHRQSDSYRPSYEDGVDNSSHDRRASLQVRDGPSTRDRILPQASIANYQSVRLRTEKSPSPSDRPSQHSRQEDKTSSPGLGIKGLAAARKESIATAGELGESSQSGLSIKGVSAQTRTDDNETLRAPLPQCVKALQNSDVADRTLRLTNSVSQKPTSVSQSEGSNATTVAAKDKFLSLTSSPSVRLNQSTTILVATSNTSSGTSTDMSTFSERSRPANLDNVEATNNKGFEFLGRCYESRDQEKKSLLAQKARTISPYGHCRPASRAKSVESAATDPMPISRPPVVAKEVCDTCGVGNSFLQRIKCAAPACTKMLHPGCGRSTKIATSAGLAQGEKHLCVACFHKEQVVASTSAPTKSIQSVDTETVQAGASEVADKSISEQRNGHQPYKARTVEYSFVTTDSPSVRPVHDNGKLANPSAFGQITTGSRSTENDRVRSRSSLSQAEEITAHQKLASLAPDTREVRETVKAPTRDPPTGPRSRRDEFFDSQAYAIAERYKNTVTCPWWKSSTCFRREEDCMFAHWLTGIESPDGSSRGKDLKDWTCYDFHILKRCRYDEQKCRFSHTDTGLNVGVDGKASKKHLECWWWRQDGHCRHADADCTCAHYFTGLAAEEPPPKDTIRRQPTQPSTASFNDAEFSQGPQKRRARSPHYSPPPGPITEDLHPSSSIQRPLPSQLTSPSQKLSNLPISHADLTFHMNKPALATETGVDPRLKRNGSSMTKIGEIFDPAIKERAILKSPIRSTTDTSLTNAPESEAQSCATPQQSKHLPMNPCKICSKRIFKALVCTDCLKLTRQNNKTQENTREPEAEKDELDIINDEITIEATSRPSGFVVPAPKVLKRSRAASGSNLFASKRPRPDLAAIRTAIYLSPATSSLATSSPTPTPQQLNRMKNEKKAKEAARFFADFEPDSSTIEVAMPNEVMRSSPKVSVTSTESVTTKSLQNCVPSQRRAHSNPTKPAKNVEARQVESLREARDESEAIQSESEYTISDPESDEPSALLRTRTESLLWSSSTSNQSPHDAHTKTSTAVPPLSRTVSAPNTTFPTTGSGLVRCATCVRYHRKCVHTLTGEFDDRKCYIWREDRLRLGIKHKAHYSESERDQIMRKARAYEATLNGDHEMVDVNIDDQADEIGTQSDTSDEETAEDDFSSSSDEIQISRRRDEAEKPASRRTTSNNMQYDSPRMLSRSPTPERRPTTSVRSRSTFIVPKGMKLVRKEPPVEELGAVIARLKARGVMFEDSDTSDDEDDDEFELPKNADPRMDPLLYHKFGDSPPQLPAMLPRITKGQGLKHRGPLLILRRQMARNRQLLGNAHKHVDRKLQSQEVTAMMERKDPDDILALPNQVEEKVTLSEFVGLQKGKEMEACLGKVPLPRGNFTRELAFKEKDMDPGLDVWGRARRGNKKEKPVFVIGS